ncbi:hypothetical protein XA68_13831 [Ophiocordyceps unilateralis]|uniref:Large ribosomal subunit protein uL6 alpha-beta domain-containing protein n=1 Tax=Ophiocordyceps unilateralis TaxID=268505 RepID=A0A2A9PNE3_OPHUN|nr:hypothetical protein XA68_13831 [Ophiocordyceps unilateralis]
MMASDNLGDVEPTRTSHRDRGIPTPLPFYDDQHLVLHPGNSPIPGVSQINGSGARSGAGGAPSAADAGCDGGTTTTLLGHGAAGVEARTYAYIPAAGGGCGDRGCVDFEQHDGLEADCKEDDYGQGSAGGPRVGTLKLDIPHYVTMSENKEEKTVQLTIEDINAKQQKEMWGTSWAYLNNHIRGVSEGHTAILRLVGVGYRAVVSPRRAKEEYPGQRFLCLKLGFTHPVEEGIPEGVHVSTPSPTRILVEGPDREALMSFAGRVRKWRPPEPYKGKGIFINDQTIKLKAKKIK